MSQKKGAKGSKRVVIDRTPMFSEEGVWRNGRVPWVLRKQGLKATAMEIRKDRL
ncbi:hypothetical protein M0R72_08690 [Candidatus Pacearchaeota archaeon]|jgi:hypothetical protein|nr:hypothetical protein [Candidatus Pacearchaeota archaeon]